MATLCFARGGFLRRYRVGIGRLHRTNDAKTFLEPMLRYFSFAPLRVWCHCSFPSLIWESYSKIRFLYLDRVRWVFLFLVFQPQVEKQLLYSPSFLLLFLGLLFSPIQWQLTHSRLYHQVSCQDYWFRRVAFYSHLKGNHFSCLVPGHQLLTQIRLYLRLK